jgi:hypothetical protein
MNSFKRAVFYFFFITLCATPYLQAQQDLPSDVNSANRSIKDIEDLFAKLIQLPSNDTSVLQWLNDNIDALPPLFRYELARRYAVVGKRNMAFMELAKARLERDMEASECINKDNNIFILFTDNMERDIILSQPHFDEELFLNAISKALDTKQQDKQTPALWLLWLCSKDNIKDNEAAKAARKAVYEFLKSDFEKISANAKKKK